MVVTQTFIFIKAIFIKIWRICWRPKRFGFFKLSFWSTPSTPFLFPPLYFSSLSIVWQSHLFWAPYLRHLFHSSLSRLPCSFSPPVFYFPAPPPLSYLFVTEKVSNNHFCGHTELHVGSSIGPGTLQCSFKPWSYLSSWGRLRLEIMTWYI